MARQIPPECDPQLSSFFFRLPPELRNLVYHHCAWNYMEVAAGGIPMDPDSFLRDQQVTPLPALLLTCKLVAREAKPVLYSFARLRYVAVLGSTRVDIHAVGRFTPHAIRHLHLEIRPICWQQACDNLARLVPKLVNLKTLHIYLPRPMDWECVRSVSGQASGIFYTLTGSSGNGSSKTATRLFADVAWRAIKPILLTAQAAGLTALELRGSYDRRFGKLAREQLAMDVILGDRDTGHVIIEQEAEEEEADGSSSGSHLDYQSIADAAQDSDINGDGTSTDDNEDDQALSQEADTQLTTPAAAIPSMTQTPAIMIRRPPPTHTGYP